MAEFNGCKNWNHWNVSLWINNDAGLYQMARRYRSRDLGSRRSRGYGPDGAQRMLQELQELGMHKTPDGARYSVTAIRAAMREMA